MNNTMFDSLIEKPQATKKWLLFPLSLVIHALVIASVLVAPLLSDGGGMPALKFVSVSLISAPPPPPPPLSGGKSKKNAHRDMAKEKEAAPAPVLSNRFVAPLEIPEEIAPEDENYGYVEGSGGPFIEGAPEGEGLDNMSISGILGKDAAVISEKTTPSHVSPPRLIKKVSPMYPTIAQNAHVQGDVVVEAVTNMSGNVITVRVLSGHPLLQSAAVQAVKQWVYEPYMINGYPKPVIFQVTVNFQLKK